MQIWHFFLSVPESKQGMALIPMLNKNYRDNGYLPEMSIAEYGDLVCFTGSDSDNYNEMPLFFHNLNFFFYGRDESAVFYSSFSSKKIRLILYIKTLLFY